MSPMMKQFYISFCRGEAQFREREYIDADFCGDDAAGNYVLRRYLWVAAIPYGDRKKRKYK